MSRPADWISRSELGARLAREGVEVTDRQMERWREVKLLPSVIQEPLPGGGSTVWFDPSTGDMVIAIVQLQAEKNDLGWIGWQLWWRGRPIDEAHWRPALVATAERLDPALDLIRTRVTLENDDDHDSGLDHTLADEAACAFKSNTLASRILTSRIVGRTLDDLPIVLRVILEVAAGNEPAYDKDDNSDDERLLVRAFDLRTSETATLAGRQFKFTQALSPMLGDIARAIRAETLACAAHALPSEIEAARDDLRRGMEVAQALYGSTKWLYGREAFGLRFADWLSRNADDSVLRAMLLLWVLLRRSGGDLLTSLEITDIHEKCLESARIFLTLKSMYESDLRFKYVLEPRRLKQALSADKLLPSFIMELESAQRSDLSGASSGVSGG